MIKYGVVRSTWFCGHRRDERLERVTVPVALVLACREVPAP